MFRFTVRDLLWLTFVVAMGLGWWIDSRELTAKLKAAQIQIMVLSHDLSLLVDRQPELPPAFP